MQNSDENFNKAIIESIQKNFLKKIKKFGLVRGEICNCARQIKISLMISEIKILNGSINFENFWGWMQQHNLLPQIIINSCKIIKDSKQFISSVISSILEEDDCISLIHKSGFINKIDELKKIMSPHINFRNKRFAHLINVEVSGEIINLEELIISLANLYKTLDYIMYYLNNPNLIIRKEWTWGLVYLQSAEDNIPFESIFKNDPAVIELQRIMQKLSIKSDSKPAELYFVK